MIKGAVQLSCDSTDFLWIAIAEGVQASPTGEVARRKP